jgi:polyadenylate-binding protein 2
MQESVDKEHSALSTQDKPEDIDARSVFVGNVDYAATPEDVQAHFAACGTILRVTILCDKITGHPKGYFHLSLSFWIILIVVGSHILSSRNQAWCRMRCC